MSNKGLRDHLND